MADPENPDPPDAGGEQDIESTLEIPNVEGSPGPDESTAGQPAAPVMTHAAGDPDPALIPEYSPQTVSAQDREHLAEPPRDASIAVESEGEPALVRVEAADDHISSLEPAVLEADIPPPTDPVPEAAEPALVERAESPLALKETPLETTSALRSEAKAVAAREDVRDTAVIELPAGAFAAHDPKAGEFGTPQTAEPIDDHALFLDDLQETSPDETTLFPATSPQDEAALFTGGFEPHAPAQAPDMAAEIIPYKPPIDEPVAPKISEPLASDEAIAASVNHEDLAGGSPPAPPPVAIVAFGAAFAWAHEKSATIAAWLRARLPKAPEKPHDPLRPTPTRRPRRPVPGYPHPGFQPSLRRIAIYSGWATVVIAASICGFFIYLTRDMPSTRSLWTRDNSPSLAFVDRRGRVIIREGAENAPPVDISKLPPYVAQSMIAIEDRRFYDHPGIDVSGLVRAAALNMKAGHVVQGGSTITQQLAKNLFLTNNRTFQRKLQEVALALWLESQFSKRQILSLYISRVYFGAGAYGVEAAAERYFDKPAKELTLPEAALLAGLVKAPSKLNPAAQDAAAKARAKIVLDEMLGAGFITAKQHEDSLKAPLKISPTNPNGNLGYFRDWIDPQLTQILGDQRDDFIIETTLDLEAQRAAESTLDRIIERERKIRKVSQGAILAMDSTGGVTTMVGGLNYGKGEGQSEFNRTTQSLRAPGSSFKYFIYMAAMAKGMSPWNIYVDKPVVYGDWAPGNYEDKYYGPVTLAAAYAKSLNMVAIQLANDVGGRAVIDTAQSLGVGKRLQDYRSLGLGAQGMTVMEMVTGYGAMASGGYPIEPHGIERVRRANGQVLWARRSATPPRQVIDDRTMRMMNYLGTRVVQAGTGTHAQIPGREIAGKTGTSNDYRDAWFIGYVPGMVAGVWVGNDNNTSMTKVTGGLLGAEIWHDVMLVALRDTPIQQLPMPQIADMPAADDEKIGAVTELPPGPVEVALPGAPAPEAPRAPLAVTPVGGDG